MEKSKKRREKALALTYGMMIWSSSDDIWLNYVDDDNDPGPSPSEIESIVNEEFGISGRSSLTPKQRREIIGLIRDVEEVRGCYLDYLQKIKIHFS